MAKTLNKSYLYTRYPEYEKELYRFLMTSEEIRKKDPAFEDIRYEIKKRQISHALVNVLDSNKIVLLINNKQLPRSFKVFAAKDIKGDKQLKIFIDCSNLIVFKNGSYVCDHVDILIAHLVNAMISLIYYADEKRFLNNHNVAEYGAEAFAKLFTHIIDYIYKISIMTSVKSKCLYLSAMYYLTNILGREGESIKGIARKISGISTREEEILELQYTESTFLNIKLFVESLGEILKLNGITLNIIVEKWMHLYSPTTVMALELFPNFSAMLTDAYVGCYINNQKTIEKIAGNSMVQFTKSVLVVGEGAV